MKTDHCDSIASGTWDSILSDHYILELYTREHPVGIQGSVSDAGIFFYHPVNLACMKNEYLEMKKSQTGNQLTEGEK